MFLVALVMQWVWFGLHSILRFSSAGVQMYVGMGSPNKVPRRENKVWSGGHSMLITFPKHSRMWTTNKIWELCSGSPVILWTLLFGRRPWPDHIGSPLRYYPGEFGTPFFMRIALRVKVHESLHTGGALPSNARILLVSNPFRWSGVQTPSALAAAKDRPCHSSVYL